MPCLIVREKIWKISYSVRSSVLTVPRQERIQVRIIWLSIQMVRHIALLVVSTDLLNTKIVWLQSKRCLMRMIGKRNIEGSSIAYLTENSGLKP
jgi:hypothetical protein